MHVQPSEALPKLLLARYYGANLGRFLSVDPLLDLGASLRVSQKWNRYSYVLNNPLKFNDPDGERENPVTRQRGIDPKPQRGVQGKIRSNASNPNVGKYGMSRKDSSGKPKFHSGVDINAKKGTPLHAAEGGTVTDIGVRGAGGNRVQVTHGDGSVATYSHLDSFAPGLKKGDQVKEDQVIGEAGTSGNAQGLPADEQHVHFSIRDSQGNSVNAEDWLNDPNAPPPASQQQQTQPQKKKTP